MHEGRRLAAGRIWCCISSLKHFYVASHERLKFIWLPFPNSPLLIQIHFIYKLLKSISRFRHAITGSRSSYILAIPKICDLFDSHRQTLIGYKMSSWNPSLVSTFQSSHNHDLFNLLIEIYINNVLKKYKTLERQEFSALYQTKYELVLDSLKSVKLYDQDRIQTSDLVIKGEGWRFVCPYNRLQRV